MPNKNYERGRRFEYRCKRELEARGWYVWRTPGSKSPADLIALKAPDWTVLIQCKTTERGVTKKARQELCELAYSCGAIPVAMWRDGSRGPLVWSRLDEPESIEYVKGATCLDSTK